MTIKWPKTAIIKIKSPYVGASSASVSIVKGFTNNSLRCVTMFDEQYMFRAMTLSLSPFWKSNFTFSIDSRHNDSSMGFSMLKAFLYVETVTLSFEWISCTNISGGHKSDFQYCMSRKLIYLSSWLTFALQFSEKHFPRHSVRIFSLCVRYVCVPFQLDGHKTMAREINRKKLFVLHFLIE